MELFFGERRRTIARFAADTSPIQYRKAGVRGRAEPDTSKNLAKYRLEAA
jgi:hypothetical protein